MIINPRGPCGSGKTELVRRILSEYGWSRDLQPSVVTGIEAIYRTGRIPPFACRLQHPHGGRPLVILGHYQVTSGGCDTIRARDGGIPEVIRCAGDFMTSGHDVIIEGLRLSSEVERSAMLAASHGLHIVLLSTRVEDCVRNLALRRRARRSSIEVIERNTAEEHRRVKEACERLRPQATIEVFEFGQALARVKELLGLRDPEPRSALAETTAGRSAGRR